MAVFARINSALTVELTIIISEFEFLTVRENRRLPRTMHPFTALLHSGNGVTNLAGDEFSVTALDRPRSRQITRDLGTQEPLKVPQPQPARNTAPALNPS